MFSKTLLPQRPANRLHGTTRNKSFVSAVCHAKQFAKSGMVVACAALLLSACGSLKTALSGDQVELANPPLAVAAGVKRTRMTSRDIMLEWSTVSGDRAPYKTKKAPRSSPLDRVLEEPDYAVSIKQIMANATCRSCEQKPYHQMVVNASNRHGVPTSLIHAVIQKESSYNPSATSKRRARGLMQITPETARFVGVSNSKQLYDPQTNIYTGTAYLKYLLANHDTVDEALAAYNAGPGNVRKYKGVPPFKETKRYVRDVKELYATTSR
jgi:hypothetical protein